MGGDNKIYCTKCKKYYDVAKECFLNKLSKYLIIFIKRFKYDKIKIVEKKLMITLNFH